MPFQSEKQRRYLWANEPEIARDWTDTYGNRIQKNDGGIMHHFQNYAQNDGNNVSVPRSFQARPQSDQVNLAYITPQEQQMLQALKPGTPHRGPMEIPNYDSFDAAGGYTSGTAMSAAETGSSNQRDRAEVRASNIGGPKGLAPGVTSNQAQDLRNSFLNARAMGQRGSGFNFNPLSIIGGAFGNVGRGIGFLLGKGKDWAGKMRGGINPKTGRYYTQREYEDERSERIRNKRIQNILGRKAPITKATHDLLGRLDYEGTLPDIGSTRTSRAIDRDYTMQDTLREYPITRNRIRDIQKGWNNQGITGIDQPLYDEMTDNVALSKLRAGTDTDVMKGSVIDKKPFDWSMFNPFGSAAHADIMTKEDLEKFGADRTMTVSNETLDDLEDYYQSAITAPMHYTSPQQIRNFIKDSRGLYGNIDMTNIPETFMSQPSDFPAESRFGELYKGEEKLGTGQVSPYKLFGE